MSVDETTLLDQLAAHVATTAGLNFTTVPAGESRELYTDRLDRRDAEAAAAVLRFTGGPGDDGGPVTEFSVQCFCQGPTPRAVLQLAWSIYRVFVRTDRLAVANLALTTWKVLTVLADQKPSLIRVGDADADASFNWTIRAVPTA